MAKNKAKSSGKSKPKGKSKPAAAKAKKSKELKKPAKVAKPVKKPAAKMAKEAAKSAKATPKTSAKENIKNVLAAAPVEEAPVEVVLTNAEGKRYCKVADCDEVEAIDSYCRLHYIMYWKRNKTKAKILEGGKLDKYIEELTNRYPDKYLEMLKKDLQSEKEFNGIIAEMDAEDAEEELESEEDDNRFIEEVRGTVTSGGTDDDESF